MDVKNLAVISFDGIHLLLPQQSVATIEMVSNIADETEIPGSLGTLKAGGGRWPVYALTAEFKPQADLPASYKYCVAINRDNQEAFSIVCEEVSTISINNIDELKPLQACMQLPGSPVESLLLRDHKLMLVSGTELMSRFLLQEEAA